MSGGSADSYQARFDRLAADGQAVHGEADFVAGLVPAGARVLDAGCGTGRVAIELARRGYQAIGVDVDERMLARARRTAPELVWLRSDLAELDVPALGTFDLVVAAGNVIPLVAAGTERAVLTNLARVLHPGGLLVTGFGLDAAHLPLDEAPFGLDQYDAWSTEAGLAPLHRYATWDGDPYVDGGGYAVSVQLVPIVQTAGPRIADPPFGRTTPPVHPDTAPCQ